MTAVTIYNDYMLGQVSNENFFPFWKTSSNKEHGIGVFKFGNFLKFLSRYCTV